LEGHGRVHVLQLRKENKMKFKYIITNDAEAPILFPEYIDHSFMGRKFGEKNPVSAGRVNFFIENGDIVASCIMGSVSLKIERNAEREEEDSKIITRLVKMY
jgi:hypothetical protein